MMEHVSQLNSLLKKHLIASLADVVGTQEASQVPNGRLENVETLDAWNGEVDILELGDGDGKVFVQVHQVECVE